MIAITKKALKSGVLFKCALVGLVSMFGATQAISGEAEIKQSIQALYPTAKVDAVRPTPVKGIFEATIGTEVVYSDENGKFLMFGNLVDATTKKSLTDATKERLSKIDFKDLPLDLAIKTVKGNGARVFAVFEDPNCGYCKKMHDGLKNLTNYTMYSFLVPILSEDSKAKTKAILCSADKSQSLANWMDNNIIPAGSSCETNTAKVMEIANKLGIRGTPTTFFEDGNRSPGYLPETEFDQRLNAAKTNKG